MYWRDKWEFLNSIEYEFKYAGKYGARGEKREKKKKPTGEQVRKQNQINRENRMRRLIKKNFHPDDMWATLKYPKGERPEVETVKKHLRAFLESVRKKCRRRGRQFKFIYRMEIGKRGGIHIHILVNRIRDMDLLLQGSWKHGRIHYESIHEYGGYRKLAEYIVKEPKEEELEQLSFLPEEERKELVKYSSSRNLIRPVPERKKYRRGLKKLIEEGPKPTPGFYIDKNSIVCGKNPYTGMSYYKYTECRIREITGREAENERSGHLYRNKPESAKKRRRHVSVHSGRPGASGNHKG